MKKKLIFCLIISIVFLLIGTKSSPLYTLNDWYDAQCFFTMGKSMMNGSVPYLDLFEQKGPLLFLIYGIASLISTDSFIGVFIIEVIAYTIFLYYIDKIITMYLPEKYSYILLTILSLLILSSRSFTHGGSCEELCFPLLAITVYYFIKYLKNNYISNKETLIIGILTGCIFWMKYTLLGFSFGFVLAVAIKKIKNKEWKDFIIKIFYFLLGITVTSIPWIIYFGIHKGGLKSLVDIYFLFNITSYADNITITQKIINFFITIKGVLIKYYQYLILIIIPMIISIKTKLFFNHTKDNICLLISTLLLLTFLFIGGTNYRYYSLPMQPLMIFGLIYIASIIDKNKIGKLIKNHHIIVTILTIIICLPIAYYRSPNTEYIKKDKNDYAQYTFLEEISPNSTILNYGFLDGGFYFTTKTYPTQYYFQKNNIKYDVFPQNIDEQRKYIQEKRTDYVIASNKTSKQDLELLEKNYILIKTHTQKYEEHKRTYYLYQRREQQY